VSLDTETYEIVLGGIGTPFTEREVVFARAAFVAVALDGGAHVGELLQVLGLLPQGGLIFGIDVVLVGIEVDGVAPLHLLREVLLRTRNRPRLGRSGRRRSRLTLRRRRKVLRRFLLAGREGQRARQGHSDGDLIHGSLLQMTRTVRPAFDIKRDYGRTGPQAGSDAPTGVGRRRSFRPVKSTCQIEVSPEFRSVRKNCTMRPLGDQVGAS